MAVLLYVVYRLEVTAGYMMFGFRVTAGYMMFGFRVARGVAGGHLLLEIWAAQL